MKHRILCGLLVIAVLQGAICAARSEERLPNIVLIYADDIGYGDVGCYGGLIPTPHLDRLARQGLRFTNGYSPAATCTPSRFALLTGLHPFRQANTGIARGDAPLLITPDTTTVADILARAGYATGIVGKWHLGLGDPGMDWNGKIAPGPLELGFDYCFLMPATGDRVPCVYVEGHHVVNLDPDDPLQIRFDQPYPNEPNGRDNRDQLVMDWSHGHNMAVINGIGRIGYMTGGKSAIWNDETMADVFVEKSLDFIEANKDSPFFLFFSAHDNHVPRVPHPRFAGASGQGPRGDAVVQFDDCVGRIIAKLEERKLAENTLVIVTSDNGPVLDDGYKDQANERLSNHRPAGALRAGKYSIFEGGTRAPFIASWPGKIKPGVSEALISQVDFSATFAALVGQSLAAGEAVDSANVLMALLGQSETGREYVIQYTQVGPHVAIRRGPWKYIPPGKATRDNLGPWQNTPIPATGMLFHLTEDPGETSNRVGDHPDIVDQLREQLEAIRGASESPR